MYFPLRIGGDQKMKFLIYLSFVGIGLFGYLTIHSLVIEDYNFALMWGGFLIMDIGVIISHFRNNK